MTETIPSSHAAAAITPTIVDREPILMEIEGTLAGSDVQVYYLTGQGGIGKTFLLREFLQRASKSERAERDLLVAREIVDFYHPYTHTAEGLCRTIRRVLQPGLGYFDDFEEQQERMERALRDMQMGREIGVLRELMTRAFLEDVVRLTDDYRVVLAFDTSELLLYEVDPIQGVLEIGQPGIEVRDWFLQTFLPSLKNAVVLLAGRDEPPQLRTDLRAALPGRLFERSLDSLEEDDSLAYFDAVAQGARDRAQTETAERIDEIPEPVRRVIHRYVGGRPILLSLVLDYLVVTDRLLSDLRTPLAEVKRLSREELATIQQALESEIVRAIQETGRPTDETVRTLAWTRRGLDAPMFAQLAGVDVEEAQRRLDEVKGLSFVKVRPDDQRVFLQDEMYALIQKHVLDSTPPGRAWKVYSTLITYYEKEIRAAREHLGDLQEAQASNVEELGKARLYLQNAIAEKVHYELRRDPVRGFEAYYRAAEEAFQSRHESMDMQLREELLTFLKQARPELRSRIEDLAVWDAGVRWVKRHILRSLYKEATRMADRLQSQEGERMARLGLLAEVELNIWGANAQTYAGLDLDLAQQRLQQSIEQLNAFEPANEFDAWRRTILLANTYNNLGYLLRTRGAHGAAAEKYPQALPHWRALGKGSAADHANTLNNLAFALAERGAFNQALRYCQDGLELREALGPRYPIALSLNTLAMIQIRNDQPHRAETVARRALSLFQQVRSLRGQGLAYRALAEALRRQIEVPGMYSIPDQAKKLREAEGYADEAVSIFSRHIKEQGRLVESLIELGCVYRNWAHIRPEYDSSENGSAPDLARRATRTLSRAVKEAGDSFPHLKVDALVNLAWHHFYGGNLPQARSTVEEQVFPLVETYLITEEQGVPDLGEPVSFFWVQLGKASNLLGQIEMERFEELHRDREGDWEAEAEHCLKEVARQFTLAVAYDQLFGHDFREMRRGLDMIYNRFKKLNARELGLVYDTVAETAARFDLKPPCYLTRFLEESFGPRESLDEVVGRQENSSLSSGG